MPSPADPDLGSETRTQSELSSRNFPVDKHESHLTPIVGSLLLIRVPGIEGWYTYAAYDMPVIVFMTGFKYA